MDRFWILYIGLALWAAWITYKSILALISNSELGDFSAQDLSLNLEEGFEQTLEDGEKLDIVA